MFNRLFVSICSCLTKQFIQLFIQNSIYVHTLLPSPLLYSLWLIYCITHFIRHLLTGTALLRAIQTQPIFIRIYHAHKWTYVHIYTFRAKYIFSKPSAHAQSSLSCRRCAPKASKLLLSILIRHTCCLDYCYTSA